MRARIRDYAPADHDAVVALVAGVLAEFGFASNVGGLEKDLAEVGARYGGARAGFWVAEVDGQVVGTVAIRAKDAGVADAAAADVAADTCELKRLYIRADARGTGLGQALYAHAEAFARAAGYARVWLDSSRRFVAAHRLYRRNDFVLVASLDNDWEDDVYEKRL